MKVIVGLGNPGAAYEGTRHNVGWRVMDALAGRHQVTIDRRLRHRWQVVARYADSHTLEQTVRFVKPETMMNRSGEVLAALPKLAPEELLLVCDDVNLPLGRLRLRAEGGAGGHHGLQSCFDAMGTGRVARLRCGVGGGGSKADLSRYVLQTFGADERERVDALITWAAEACEVWIAQGIEVTMNQFNAEQES